MHVGPAIGSGAPLDARWESKGQHLSDPKNHYLRTLLLGLHAPCAAQHGAERLGGKLGKPGVEMSVCRGYLWHGSLSQLRAPLGLGACPP